MRDRDKKDNCIICGNMINKSRSQGVSTNIRHRRKNAVTCSPKCSRVYASIYRYCSGKLNKQKQKQVEELLEKVGDVDELIVFHIYQIFKDVLNEKDR